MKFQTFTIVSVLLAATAYAAPATHHQTTNPVTILITRDSINDCGDSTFTNESTGGSPTVSDCQQIATNIAGGGTWHVEGYGIQHQLVQYGTCAFGVTNSDKGFKIGNQDIIDLINGSISRFQWSGLVGAKGEMSCQDDFSVEDETVSWGLYHT
ncbi:hypothetical protein N7510_007974 [Penicillium lagena]|uniref:uncharacterized protein n=1 Tax=Penicillium lagena TaxID=94218 RepID=UPI0025400B5F|nr:uncharacterized protein N7510_007974 [Penicillium lagena]KAJ5611255.1 hypothetical protein N7510_007974 [Penicillium lagena]